MHSPISPRRVVEAILAAGHQAERLEIATGRAKEPDDLREDHFGPDDPRQVTGIRHQVPALRRGERRDRRLHREHRQGNASAPQFLDLTIHKSLGEIRENVTDVGQPGGAGHQRSAFGPDVRP